MAAKRVSATEPVGDDAVVGSVKLRAEEAELNEARQKSANMPVEELDPGAAINKILLSTPEEQVRRLKARTAREPLEAKVNPTEERLREVQYILLGIESAKETVLLQAKQQVQRIQADMEAKIEELSKSAESYEAEKQELLSKIKQK